MVDFDYNCFCHLIESNPYSHAVTHPPFANLMPFFTSEPTHAVTLDWETLLSHY